MAIRLPDGSIQLADKRIVFANSLLNAADFIEILPLFIPPPAWPFISGGGGGIVASTGGTAGTQGFQGAVSSQVVPASFVVSDIRGDYPLTQAGLIAAIAALPAAGGDIYLGAGTLAITSAITLSKNLKITGAGPGVTILSVTGAVSMFQAGDIELTISDLSVVGTDTVGQTFLTLTADALPTKYTNISNIRIGTNTGFSPDGVRVIFNAAGFARSWVLTDLTFFTVAAGSFLASGASGSMRMSNVTGGGLFSGSSISVDAVNTTIFASGNFSFGNQSKFANCRLTTSGTAAFGTETIVANTFLICDIMTFGASSAISNGILQCTLTTMGNTCSLSGTTVTGPITLGNTCSWEGGSVSGVAITGTSCKLTNVTMSSTLTAGASSTFSSCTIASTAAPAASCLFSGCTIGGAVTVSGASTKFANCTLVSFSSTSLNSHEITNCSFSGGGNNVTLASSSSCIVRGNITCQVIESGSTNSCIYSDNTGFDGSTIIGTTSILNNWNARIVTTTPILLTDTHRTVLADATAAPIVIDLPTAASAKYRTYTVKKTDASANAVTVTPNGAETIDGVATAALGAQWASVRFISSGTAWFIEDSP